jgi:hypothetical protein
MKKILSAACVLACLPIIASAHAFGQQYTLPLPLWLYIYGGGITIIVSFLLIGYFISDPNPEFFSKSKTIGNFRAAKLWKLVGLVLFLVTIIAGFAGNNLAPLIFWIFFLLGFTYFTAIIGNTWDLVNPWRTIAEFFGTGIYKYPKKLGFTPALTFYAFIIWLELLSGGAGVVPYNLSLYLILYTSISVLGSVLFGVIDWFYYGDFFSVFFGLISRLSPITIKDKKIILRWPLAGLLAEGEKNVSLLLFVIFMLSSTAFDGFRDTLRAYKIFTYMKFTHSSEIKQLLLFAVIYILFLLIFVLAIWLMKLIVRSTDSTLQLSLIFIYSLIPIVLAYNLAHYFTLVLFTIKVGLIGAKTVWQFQLLFIIVGHIAAVYIAHLMALREFRGRKFVFASQLPMLAVMVAYTMAGLWILAQPLTI